MHLTRPHSTVAVPSPDSAPRPYHDIPDRAPGTPLVVAYGAGVNSTAMLIALHQRALRPDLILFADTGSEWPETYAYLPVMDEWLRRHDFPPVTMVRYRPQRAPYRTLVEKCRHNQTLPSLAFGKHSCSLVFKVAPQDRYLAGWAPALAAWAHGQRVWRALGYDAGARDGCRSAKAQRAQARRLAAGDLHARRYHYWYPLQAWQLDRPACARLILRAGLPLPRKSACTVCPATSKPEIVELRTHHPLLFWEALEVEQGARDGRHGLRTVRGLGRSFAWAELAEADAVTQPASVELLRP